MIVQPKRPERDLRYNRLLGGFLGNSDEAVSLAIIDQIEAAMTAGEVGADERARELVETVMDQPNGVMFVLQGVKAMLVWMQEGQTDE